jgi:hypothetical protein
MRRAGPDGRKEQGIAAVLLEAFDPGVYTEGAA